MKIHLHSFNTKEARNVMQFYTKEDDERYP